MLPQRQSQPEGSWVGYAGMAAASALVLTGILVALTGGKSGPHRFNDFYTEAWPAYQALLHGHVIAFIQRGPAYTGSLILRAPFALIPRIWGGGWRAVYVASALPCLMAVPAFLSWLLYQRRDATPLPHTIGVMLVGTFNPPLLVAIFGGHPEDALGVVLCLAAVIAAVRDRPGWCATFLSLAIVNKSWALVAFPVALAVLPSRRFRTGAIVTAVAAAVLVPIAAVQQASSGADVGSVTGTGVGALINPSQLFWWAGRGSWLTAHARFFLVGGAFVLVAAWWMRARQAGAPRNRTAQALLILSLVLLLRAALDPWDNVYYHLPFLLALLAYEVHVRRWPVASTVFAVLVMFIAPVQGVGTLGLFIPVQALTHPSGNLQAAAYALVVVPTVLWLAFMLFRRKGREEAAASPVQSAGIVHPAWAHSPTRGAPPAT
jgi:hypothetical protein